MLISDIKSKPYPPRKTGTTYFLCFEAITDSVLQKHSIGFSPLRRPTELPPLPATLLTLGLWLGRSIIVPIKSHRPQSCRLHYDANISRSYSFSSIKKDEVEAKLSSWRIRHLARPYRNVSVCLLCCTAVILRAFFVK